MRKVQIVMIVGLTESSTRNVIVWGRWYYLMPISALSWVSIKQLFHMSVIACKLFQKLRNLAYFCMHTFFAICKSFNIASAICSCIYRIHSLKVNCKGNTSCKDLRGECKVLWKAFTQPNFNINRYHLICLSKYFLNRTFDILCK